MYYQIISTTFNAAAKFISMLAKSFTRIIPLFDGCQWIIWVNIEKKEVFSSFNISNKIKFLHISKNILYMFFKEEMDPSSILHELLNMID